MKYVIIGTGNISNTYINAIKAINGQVVGCISRSGSTPKQGAELPIWSGLDEVDLDYDAVVIATPNGEHHKGIIAAAQAIKPVVVEKPIDISLEAADAAIQACEQAGVTLAVAYQHRSAPDNQALKSLFDQNAFGRIFAADLAAKFYRPQSYYDSGDYRGGFAIDGGGPFMQQASHNLDLYTWFFGVPEQVISMINTFDHDIETEDHGAALFKHPSGMIGTVVASTVAKPGYAARLEVHTEKGSFTLVDDFITEWHVEGVENPSDPSYSSNHDGATSAAVTDTRAHQAILLNFEQCIADKSRPIADGYSARKTTELISKIYASAI
jgi:UDP-N-acetyl-2-amino-2-deoxyglucuronate dehydrogenase